MLKNREKVEVSLVENVTEDMSVRCCREMTGGHTSLTTRNGGWTAVGIGLTLREGLLGGKEGDS